MEKMKRKKTIKIGLGVVASIGMGVLTGITVQSIVNQNNTSSAKTISAGKNYDIYPNELKSWIVNNEAMPDIPYYSTKRLDAYELARITDKYIGGMKYYSIHLNDEINSLENKKLNSSNEVAKLNNLINKSMELQNDIKLLLANRNNLNKIAKRDNELRGHVNKEVMNKYENLESLLEKKENIYYSLGLMDFHLKMSIRSEILNLKREIKDLTRESTGLTLEKLTNISKKESEFAHMRLHSEKWKNEINNYLEVWT
ncbi:MAG: hypothetical protein HRT99_03545 [Mycoplasmatales bacterium]|nr:hypothetical protein [Mycoplasmatales bacterium]